MKRFACVGMISLSCINMASANESETPATIPIQRLTMELAVKMAKAAIDECRKSNVNIAVTVVDRGGHPQVVLRDTLAMDLALTISQQKAYTAMSFNTPTSQMVDRFPGSYSVPKVEGIIIASGGLPITGAGSAILGGVGVSGSPSGALDEKCAAAGLNAIKFDLEGF